MNDDSQTQQELFDFKTYPERWAFRTTRSRGFLQTEAYGFYRDDRRRTDRTIRCLFEYRNKGWIRTSTRCNESSREIELTPEQEADLYREFAHHKAYYLKTRTKKPLQGELARTTRRGY